MTNSANAKELAIDGASFDAFERAGWERVADAYHDFAGGITPRVVEPLLDAASRPLAKVDRRHCRACCGLSSRMAATFGCSRNLTRTNCSR